ncbi:MAG: hypothetical protein AVDCRST_MAG68-5484, partial [uncultured Gemmatimonadetes bacterium]
GETGSCTKGLDAAGCAARYRPRPAYSRRRGSRPTHSWQSWRLPSGSRVFPGTPPRQCPAASYPHPRRAVNPAILLTNLRDQGTAPIVRRGTRGSTLPTASRPHPVRNRPGTRRSAHPGRRRATDVQGIGRGISLPTLGVRPPHAAVALHRRRAAPARHPGRGRGGRVEVRAPARCHARRGCSRPGLRPPAARTGSSASAGARDRRSPPPRAPHRPDPAGV